MNRHLISHTEKKKTQNGIVLKLRYYAYHNTENIFKWKDRAAENKKRCLLYTRDGKAVLFPLFIE